MSGEQYLRRALELATRGLGRTSPNPAVGAVVVSDGQIVGEGYHRRAGEPHAERVALLAAGEAARGADLYCTLEPCCHQGRTPPCTELIIASGVRRLWYASADPDPRCAGQGAARLREAGVEVHPGLLAGEADRLNEAYFKHKHSGLPFVTLKLAMSLDGKVATRTGHSRWITGEAARELVHQWRDQSDAVVVGVGTVLADDPQLTVRPDPADGRQPLRVIVDSWARTAVTARAVSREHRACLVAVTGAAPADRAEALRATGAEVLILPETGGRVDLGALMSELGRRDVMSVLCEGGPGLAAGLVAGGLVDKYRLLHAALLIGAEGLSAIGPLGLDEVGHGPHLTIDDVGRIGPDVLVTAYPCSPD
jgi:diaminohydroxyphosphoribosylaminopyrimidine deaminase / 5-amino-6-(5-phosphoribosylamino)uracil reductase